ncbi:hypothetical protein [Pararcticibacter amylolyticus]|uniref:Cell wall anchor protein n=1 Tax=Pararcticibacter amylolyticus TaxID=2173175 RepID=A0A2U2P9P7_9SPHI|nr:hypothetical protein [Pararcticibacter amylolyticus]PWG78065.1 hypothetical protein DDR33_24140 [Pararcticibacter amylolyticus]
MKYKKSPSKLLLILILSLSYIPYGKSQEHLERLTIGSVQDDGNSSLQVANSVRIEGTESGVMFGEPFIPDGTIKRWVFQRRNDNFFGGGNNAFSIWADKSGGYFCPLVFSNNGDLFLNPGVNAVKGNVGIGTIHPTAKLTVAGAIHSTEIKVSVDAGADYVFHNEYKLPALGQVESFIKTHQHLPGIAPAGEMEKDGINLSEMNMKLLKKIEELTLYLIEQNREMQEYKKSLNELQKSIELLKTQQKNN